ncbi:MAG: tolC 1 [Firmicutes bacterium]|nr:tolC 1 [Bacillota bacterium]
MINLTHKAAVITAGLIFLQHTFALAAPVELSLQDSIAYALKNNPRIKI